jgi:methyl-accepting chemotaxis protein
MSNFLKVVSFLICASFATGFTSTILAATQAAPTCQPSVTKIEPAEVTAGLTATVALIGSCLTPDVVVGFSADPSMGLGQIPLRGVSYSADKMVLSLDVPADKKVSRRQMSMKVGTGEVKRTAIFLKVVSQGMTESREIEYVTKPAFFAALRKVELKADRAVGLAQQANGTATRAEDKAVAAQQAAADLSKVIKEFLGDSDEDGKLTKQLKDLIVGLQGHGDAIKEIREQIDTINNRPAQVSVTADEIAAIHTRIDNLDRLVRALAKGVVNPITIR